MELFYSMNNTNRMNTQIGIVHKNDVFCLNERVNSIEIAAFVSRIKASCRSQYLLPHRLLRVTLLRNEKLMNDFTAAFIKWDALTFVLLKSSVKIQNIAHGKISCHDIEHLPLKNPLGPVSKGVHLFFDFDALIEYIHRAKITRRNGILNILVCKVREWRPLPTDRAESNPVVMYVDLSNRLPSSRMLPFAVMFYKTHGTSAKLDSPFLEKSCFDSIRFQR
ncbi:hypothetical protein ACOME3_002822 [Neoechinorhynchus agilis]